MIERAVLPALILGLLSGSLSAQKPPTLSDADLQTEATNLRASLAGADEEAFTQILTHVTVERDPVVDTIAVYDIVVHYDPDRYSSPRVGAYPLSFENQFIHWGRRIALYTTRTSWKSGRFYLRDISTAHEAWIFTEDARLLLGPWKKKVPSNSAQWLRFVHSLPPQIDLRTMGYWLRLMRVEERELTILRMQREIKERENSLLKDLQP